MESNVPVFSRNPAGMHILCSYKFGSGKMELEASQYGKLCLRAFCQYPLALKAPAPGFLGLEEPFIAEFLLCPPVF